MRWLRQVFQPFLAHFASEVHITSTGAPPGDTRNMSIACAFNPPRIWASEYGRTRCTSWAAATGKSCGMCNLATGYRHLSGFRHLPFFFGGAIIHHLILVYSRVQGRRTGILSIGSEPGGSAALTTFGFLFLPEVCPGSHHENHEFTIHEWFCIWFWRGGHPKKWFDSAWRLRVICPDVCSFPISCFVA